MTSILLISDSHINSKVGLSLPIVDCDDGRTEKYSRLQKTIYTFWIDVIKRAQELSKSEGLITVFCGDIGDLDCKYNGYQIITKNMAFVKKHVIKLISPICDISKHLYFVKGTPAHVGESGFLEEAIGDDFDNTVPCKKTNAKSWEHLPLKIDGVKIDIAHHTSMSGIPWNKSNAVLQLAARTLFSYAEHNQEPPDLVIRGHVHRGSDSYDAFRVRAITLRGLTFGNDYISRINPGAFGEIGVTIIHTKGKPHKYEIEKIELQLEDQRWETPK